MHESPNEAPRTSCRSAERREFGGNRKWRDLAGPRPRRRVGIEIVSQGQNSNVPEASEREHRLVAGHDQFGIRREGALRDSTVGFVLQRRARLPGLGEFGDVGEKHGDSGELLAVAGELAGKNREISSRMGLDSASESSPPMILLIA